MEVLHEIVRALWDHDFMKLSIPISFGLFMGFFLSLSF